MPALNRADAIRGDLPYVMENAERLLGTRVVPISAQNGDGILGLIPEI